VGNKQNHLRSTTRFVVTSALQPVRAYGPRGVTSGRVDFAKWIQTQVQFKTVPLGIRFCRSADGTRIAFSTNGNGPPLVQAPTWLTHLELDWESRVWRSWMNKLSDGHTLVRHDLRGCGLSDRDVADTSLASWVADLEAVVDALALDRFPLFGLCQGGAIAAAYAARHPERVSALVLFGSYVQGALAHATGAFDVREVEALATLIETGWARPSPAFREVFASLLMPQASPDAVRALGEMERHSTTPEMARRLWLAFHGIDIEDVAARLTVPTLVLHCRHDAMVPFAEGRRLATLIPGARFVALEGCNHILQSEDRCWTRFWDEVLSFVAPNQAAVNGTTPAFSDLTHRERQLLELIARGRSNGEIAAQLAISPKTVRNHITNVFGKLGVSRRAEAIVLARDAGLGQRA
jgi:pimeloyl-ACP methyl ester carboxylesterase/DNA-binding CsgD family transcriptional regulator